MADTPTVEPATAVPVQSIEVETEVKQEDAAEEKSDDDGAEAEGNDATGEEASVSNEQYKALRNITETLTNHKIKVKGDDEHYPSVLFRRIPNRRNLPDYHEIIQEPAALSTLKGKIQRKQYTGIPEFVRDFALIVHNAQVYNLPNSGPVRDVLVLQDVFKEELQKLVNEGLAKEEETIFPDLGEIPYATPEPDPVSDEDEDNEDDAEEEDEDEEADESDEDRRRTKSRRGGRPSISGRKSRGEEDEKLDDADVRKRRGRPPKVDTPMEARIKAVLKGLRKPKDKAGNLKIRHFERLPDKAEYPAYFMAIKEPIALDTIKKKSKRKKYQSLEQFMKDIDLLYNNAKQFNEEGSEIYNDAVDLQAEAHKLLETEKAKPDDEYLLEDGRRPLPSGILYKNELWKVGDWIHISNPNDVTKPIVAQIYRTWEDPEGQKWINACWYYRPEQTVHQYEKHFFPNEVVKTGQYRDHKIEEVVDRCFVMFVTRYSRGRPRDVDPRKEVYVCEARYNEEKHRFNKIKTWASCLPDEVRDKDYEMDLFEQPRRIKKVPSPLKHLLKDDMKETDEISSPQWGHPNAPPIVGAIHKHPRDENQSPPPEPTPPPPPTPPQPIRQPSISTMSTQPIARPSIDRTPSISATNIQPQPSRPSLTPQVSSYQPQSISPAPPSYSRQTSYPQSQTPLIRAAGASQTPSAQQPLPFAARQQLHPQPSLTAAHPTSYTAATPSQAYSRPQPQQTTAYSQYSTHMQDQRGTEVYVLSNIANESIPKHIRDRFPQDDEGRVLFFTQPPVLPDTVVRGRDGQPLAHTEKYLAAKAERDKIVATRKRAREEANSTPFKKGRSGTAV
ncbi:hypothetical protein H2202_004946 [Exophiala xenobiotica]|nr:hypothetical protein H2202_004946 [Exophiala xenobiotica]KAK5400470.1 hypothetical protein LTR79_002571 [Exophiala xenobiotica]KAK5420775.1 hypothetical protein LTR90_003668 [Exophiala xenobiotica]KAK5469678.1 hypothetical protein LTR20_002188 [Exophiala xenobiotica]KAK5498907.1 hypothetical protein LTR83_004215 [Exophiala xenobiotica]